MKQLIKFELYKIFKSKNIYLCISLLILLVFAVTLISYKTYDYKTEYNYIELEGNENQTQLKDITENDLLYDYIKNNNINNQDKVKNTFNNILTLLMFVGYLICITSSKIMINEYDNGTIKNILTKSYNRYRVFLSKYLCIIIIFLLYIFIIYSFSLFFVSIIYDINVFNLKSFIYTSNIESVAFISKYTFDYILCSLPILFLSLITYTISILCFNGYITYIISIILLTFGPTISNILLSLNINVIKYTFLPYLDYKVLLNKINVHYINNLFNTNISILNGNIILLIYLFLLTLISLYIFNKKDIKK